MKIVTSTIHAGAKKPFSLLHMTDTHLMFADERDDERRHEVVKWRWTWLRKEQSIEKIEFVTKLAREKGLTVIHTGDLIDFVSEANLDRAKAFAEEVDLLLTAGNHEFSQYVEWTDETPAYRAQTLDKVQAVHKNDILFDTRQVNGVNLILLYNSYYQIEPWIFSRLKEEAQKGLPMILFMHVPLYSEETYQFIWNFQRAENFPENASAGLMAVPPEKMAHYTKECYKQQASHPYTDEAFAYIKNEPLIKAVVTGHIHKDFECMIDGHLQQIVTDRESVREIYID